MSRFAYLVGSDEHRELVLEKDKGIPNSGSTDIYLLRALDPKDYTRLHITPNYFRQQRRHRLDRFDCMLNLVTDADSNPKVLAAISRMVQGQNIRLINKPEAVANTTRDKVGRICAGIPGLIVPSVCRIRGGTSERALAAVLSGSDVRYPAILRQTGTHTGKTVTRVENAGDVLKVLTPSRRYYLTQFIDYRTPSDRFFRKYRAFIIGGRVIFRHMLVAPEWNVHARVREGFMLGKGKLCDEEEVLLCRGLPDRSVEILHEVAARTKLDFLGIDFGYTPDGTMVLFEANATMNFFPFSDRPEFHYLRACLGPAQSAFDELLYRSC